MLNWVEIAAFPSPERLSVLERYLTEKGIPNKVEYIQATRDGYAKILKEVMEKYDAIRIGRGLGDCSHMLFNNNSVLVQKFGTADCAVKVNGKWELRIALYEGLNSMVAKVGSRFDLNSHVLVVGTGAVARATIAALARAGFSRFGISDQAGDRVDAFCKEMKKVFLSTVFQPIPQEELILLPGQYGVLVNTTPLSEGNEILDELSYFNFFQKNAVAFDFTTKPIDTPLLVEAKEVGVYAVYGHEIAAATDEVWVNWVLGPNVDMSGYKELLEKELRSSN
jgi:shikimate 5-dehydrogenase